jgi:hypothetical protein
MLWQPPAGSRRPLTLLAAALASCLGDGAALAMDPPEAKLPAATGIFAMTDADSLFLVTSPLAASPQAKVFIEWRLGQWEREKASLRVLAEALSDHYHEKAMVTRADIAYELGVGCSGHEEECISNETGGSHRKWISAKLMKLIEKTLPDADHQVSLQKQQTDRYLRLLQSFTYDDVSFGLLTWLSSAPADGQITRTAVQLAEILEEQHIPRDSARRIVQGMRTLDECCRAQGELNSFILEWLRQAGSRNAQDLALLKANRDTPEQIRIPGSAPAGSMLPETVEVVEVAESVAVEEDKAGVVAGECKLPAAAKPEAAPAFAAFYRFVDSPQRPQPVTAAFRVGKRAARIREQVAARAIDLTSGEVIRLVKALEPYGARCEEHRKKGVMLKLPAADPQLRYVAKFIHRSHATDDGLDCHSVAAIKELFDASVFTLERFRAQ